jgi:hypothetical protein
MTKLTNFVITGHTQGIGKSIFNKFGGIGLSRAAGFNIVTDSILPYITPDTIFINNAFDILDPYAQIRLLYESYEIAKHVICIGSNTPYSGIYKTSKDALSVACTDLFYAGHNVTNLRLGKVDTPFQDSYHGSKISTQTVVNTIDYILNTPERIQEISIRP